MRQKIYAEQLLDLGVALTPWDLAQHARLRGMQKKGFRPDRAHVEWADRWLFLLSTANRERGCYPEPEFSRLLGEYWLKICWYSQANLGWTSWQRFLSSPMRGWALSDLWGRYRPATMADAT